MCVQSVIRTFFPILLEWWSKLAPCIWGFCPTSLNCDIVKNPFRWVVWHQEKIARHNEPMWQLKLIWLFLPEKKYYGTNNLSASKIECHRIRNKSFSVSLYLVVLKIKYKWSLCLIIGSQLSNGTYIIRQDFLFLHKRVQEKNDSQDLNLLNVGITQKEREFQSWD